MKQLLALVCLTLFGGCEGSFSLGFEDEKGRRMEVAYTLPSPKGYSK